MILNLGSLAFNANMTMGGGTPAWGTEMGQGEGYKFVFEDMSDFFTGMVYNSIPDLENVYCPLGKGGNQQKDYEFVIGSIFNKIFVNGLLINEAKFLLLIVKKIVGEHHVGRRTLKYNPRMTYKEEAINEDCYKKMAEALGLNQESAWFVHEINIKNQDELHFTAFILDENTKYYNTNNERREDFISKLPKEKKPYTYYPQNEECVLQKIYFGTPGSGKSFKIHQLYEMSKDENGELVEDENKIKKVYRTTFHPDTDYASFIGCYKPIIDIVKGEKKVFYDFVPQTFTNAYVQAWNDLENHYFLIIEEINRGNCAQIFGDLFQLLDRNEKGYSEYPIKADNDLVKYLEKNLEYNSKGIKDGKLCLPPNLSIIASMNTSDQSLFPMDSAFKRRWAWEYVPIDYNNNESKKFTISIGGNKYSWHEFLRIINAKIKKVTSSEDKQMGNFFIKSSIDEKEFKDKVMFYLWSEVGKDNFQTNDAVFHCYKQGSKDEIEFSFNELYEGGSCQKLKDYMEILGVAVIDENALLDDEEEEITDADGNVKKVKAYYSINGEGKIVPRRLTYEVISFYVRSNPDLSTKEVLETWNPIKTLNNVAISEEEYTNKVNSTTDVQLKTRYFPLKISDGGTIYVLNNTVPKTTQNFIAEVNSKDWGINIERIEE